MLTSLHNLRGCLDVPRTVAVVQDVLVAEPSGRVSRRGSTLVLTLLVGAVAAGAVLREGPPAPLQVSLVSLDGSALKNESFVRLQLGVRVEGARTLGQVRLLLAGTSAPGLSPRGLDGGQATVQVDLVPTCPLAVQAVGDAALEVGVVDEDGRSRTVRLPLPDDGPFERLVRYRCS